MSVRAMLDCGMDKVAEGFGIEHLLMRPVFRRGRPERSARTHENLERRKSTVTLKDGGEIKGQDRGDTR
jgi:hypothetical protein